MVRRWGEGRRGGDDDDDDDDDRGRDHDDHLGGGITYTSLSTGIDRVVSTIRSTYGTIIGT